MLPMPQSPSAAEIFLEEEEDAVFGVKLRRVTYNSGLTDSFLQWQTEKVRTLRAATQERLIKELLPEHGQIDATFLITFLGTYRTFMSTEDLLAMIRERVSTHCQFHSLTTISRSNSESSVGSASTERSQSGISISSGDEELMVTGEGLARIESSDARQGATSPPLSSSPSMAYDDEEMRGTEELARSVIGRSLSMSTFSAGGMSPSLRGSRALVSQRIRMFSLMTADRDDSHRARPGLIRARAATVHAHRRGGELSPDICSSVDSPSQSPQPPYRTIVPDSKQHVRTGSDGTQRDSGNGTESQEESAPGEQDTPERNPSAVRRKLPFTRGEATVNERVSPDEARDFLGSGFHTPRPSSSQEFASASKGTQDGMPPRSLSFSPSSSSKARSRAQQSAWQGHSKPILRPTMEESTSETTPPPPYAASLEDHESGGEEEEFDDEGLEVTMIDDLPSASAMPATAGGEDGEAMASSATPRSVTSNHLDDLRLDPLDDDPALRNDACTAEPSEDKPGKEDTASDILRPLSQHGPDPKDIFKSVLSVLRVWLDQYPEDFKLPQLQMRLFGLLEECRIAPGPEFDDVYSLAEVLSSESSPVPGSTFSSPCTPTASAVNTLAMKKSSTLVSLHQRHRSTMAMQGALSLGVDVATMPRSYIDFLSIPPMKLAEQLTLIDANLFRAVVPYHCLSHFWSRRSSVKPGTERCASVTATINQFNRVAMVLSTSLMKGLQHRRVSAKENKPSHRASTIQHWVHIAQCCRILKNFSSLRAIVSALQSTAVNRLTKTWALVEKDEMLLFKELCQMASFSDNDQKTRAILMKEGTSKYSGFDNARHTKSPKGKSSSRYSDWFSGSGFVVQGVVPYLGTFLTDLTMVDSAHPDETEEGFINFQKRRKEFELLAQLMLFQKACKYEIENDNMIQSWMLQSEVLTEEQCYQTSMEMEPDQAESRFSKPGLPSSSWKSRFKKTINISSKSKKKEDPAVRLTNKSDADQAAFSSGGIPVTGINNRLFRSSFRGDPKRTSNLSIGSTASGGSSGGSNGDLASKLATSAPGKSPGGLSSASSTGSRDTPAWDDWFKDAYIIRVRLESDRHEGAYKSFLLRNDDRGRAIIDRVLRKNLIEEQVDAFTLYQVTGPGKEMRIPTDTNVFYALNTTTAQFDFVLRRSDPKDQKKRVKTTASSASVASKWTPISD